MPAGLPRGIVLRRARPGDAATVRALVEHLGYAPDPRGFTESFLQVARHPEAAVFVLADGVRVVGYLALSHRPQIRLAGRIATIDDLSVDPAYCGRGLGSALLEAALELARGLACVRIEVSTNRGRESYARGFYRKHGFIEADSALLRQP
jgi:ribosomal protein S18 acetylase RimI-like enzyme